MVMVLNRRIGRVLRENMAQYAGSLTLIILSGMMFTGMVLVGSNLTRLGQEFEIQNVQEDASFTTSMPIENLQELEAEAGAVIEETRTFDVPLTGGATLRVFSQNEKVNLPAVIEGRPLSGGDILLNPVFAEAQGYEIGDVIAILGRPFTIAGTMALPNYIYPLQSDTELMYSPQSFGIAIIPQADFAALDTGKSFYAVKFNEADPHPRAQSARFRALLLSKGIGIQQWTDIRDNKRVNSATLKLNAINTMSRVMPTTLLLLTSILISNVISRLIRRESAVTGALYALGYRKMEIYTHYLIFPLAIALAGGVIGTLLGLLTVRPMVLFMLTAFDIPLTAIDYNPGALLVSVLLPVLFLGLSGYLSIRKELKHSPVELMKGDRDQARVNVLERSLRLDRFRFKTKFQLREQLRSLSRLAFLLGGVAIATMLLLYGFTIKSSLDTFTTTNLTGTYHFQFEYFFKAPRSDPYPPGVEPFAADLFLSETDENLSFYVSGVLPDSKLLSFVDKSGASLSTDQVIITRPLAERLKVKSGDTLNVLRKLDGQAFSLKIDSLADTYVGKYIFMPLADYNAQFGLPEGSYLGLWSPTALEIPQDQLYWRKSIDESIAAINALTEPIQTMIVMYSTVAFFIGLIVIYLVTSMIIEENRASISLLKIFGYRKKEVNSLVLNSSTIVVVAGYLLGVPLILASIRGLLQSLDSSVGITLPVSINPLYILIGFVVVMLVFELSKLLSRKKVDAIPMSEALKASME